MSPFTCELVTLWPSLKLKPCFFSSFWYSFAISRSTAGTMPSRNSMTVTSAPRRAHTLPISRPITPPPITAIFFGTSFSDSAPVESTMRPPSLSTGHGGSGAT